MMTRTLTGLLCGAVALAGTALAQQPGDTTGTSPNSTQGRRSSPLDHNTGASSGSQSMHPLRGSQLMGTPVQGSNGQRLGQIRDLLVDPQSGRIEFAVLSASGMDSTTTRSQSSTALPGASSTANALGAMSGKLIPVPWQLFGQNFTNSASSNAGTSSSTHPGQGISSPMTLTLNVDHSRLQTAPSFDGSDWSSVYGADFGQRAYTHYGLDWNGRNSASGTSGSGINTGTGEGATDRSTGTPGSGVGTGPGTNRNPGLLTDPGDSTSPTRPNRGTTPNADGAGNSGAKSSPRGTTSPR